MMKLSTVSAWLDWIGSVHNREIELGLDRVKQVAGRLGILSPEIPVIMVGGTNGKGSTVAGLESIYRAAGYRVGAFTSPILFRHNEYVRINTTEASDNDFCQAYAEIEAKRDQISLTAFEYHTLAALIIFKKAHLDVMILEVGLGGRLDAVNIIDANVSAIASVGVDHVEWLGYTLGEISREKAGIFRLNGFSVFGEDASNHPLLIEASKIGTDLIYLNKNYKYESYPQGWEWSCGDTHLVGLPHNPLATQNMALVLMIVQLLQPKLPVPVDKLKSGLATATLAGRIQVFDGTVTEIFDVSHNPAAVKLLADRLADLPCKGKTLAVFSMLGDKDIPSSISVIGGQIDRWFVGVLQTKRAATIENLRAAFSDMIPAEQIEYHAVIAEAYHAAMAFAQPGDRVVIFGSFHTVTELLPGKKIQNKKL